MITDFFILNNIYAQGYYAPSGGERGLKDFFFTMLIAFVLYYYFYHKPKKNK